MKKLAFLGALICICLSGFGQVSSYTFSYTAGTYTPLAGGTALIPPYSGISGTGWFEQVYNVPLPFVYYFRGAGFSSCYINSNGYVTFGAPTLATNPRPFNVNNGQYGSVIGYGCVSTYGYANVGSGPGTVLLGGLLDYPNANPIMYGTIGTAPNRIFVVQWTNAYRSVTLYGGSASYTENLTFQIRLYESTNVAELVYNTSNSNTTLPYYPTVGLSGSNTGDYNVLNGTSWTSVTNSTASITNIQFGNGVNIPSGVTYDFTPNAAQMPTACAGTPAAATALCNVGVACGPMSLSLSNLPLSTGLTYQWQSSATNLNGSWTNITGATTAAYTMTPTATAYYRCNVACGASTTASSSVLVVYESAYPALPSYQYNLFASYPYCAIGNFNIAGGACGTSLNDVSNAVSGLNYTVWNGTSGTQYNYLDLTSSASHIKLQGSIGSPSTFTATVNNFTGPAIYGVWIDFNDNGSFLDANEYVGNIIGVSAAPSAFTLTIPANTFGAHRMRVRGAYSGAYNSSTISPTGSLQYYGSATDYLVEIVPPTPTPTNNSPVCVNGTLTLTSAALPTGATYTWTGPGGYNASTTSAANSFTVPGLALAGVYTLMTTYGGSNPCLSATTTVTVNPQPSLTNATNGGPICSGNTLTLSANGPSNVTGYSWTGPGTISTPTSSTASVLTAPASASGTYSVAVNNGTGSGCTVTYTTTAVVKASPNVSDFSVPAVPSICVGVGTTVTVNSTSLGTGSYSVNYDLTGANPSSGNSAFLFLSGTTGTFTIPAALLASTGATTITITSIQNASSCTTPTTTGNTSTFNVNPYPAAISGTPVVCEGQTTALTDAGGGTWVSTSTGNATVSGTGVVSGILAGTTDIVYTLPTGCAVNVSVLINPIPSAVTGVFNVCQGLITTLSDATLSGTWTSDNTSLATVLPATGDVTGVAAGTTTISYTLSTGCYVTAPMLVNPLPAAITGTMAVCEGLTTALTDATASGTWTSSNTTFATVAGTGAVSGIVAGNSDITYTLPTGCIATTNVTVNPLPAAITGTTDVCTGLTTTLSDATAGGTWTSGAASLATVVGGTGVVTGVAAGNPNITYTVSTGCIAVTAVTVNQSPTPISGSTQVCEGLTTALFNGYSGGTWVSSDPTFASVVSGTGVVTGVAAGTATITYTLTNGCMTNVGVLVNPLPAGITGTTSVCSGLTTSLNDGTSGGAWSSSDNALASVSGSGVVTGMSAGTPTITYTLPTGCIATMPVTVLATPVAITGGAFVCEGYTLALADASAGGTWGSTNPSFASVDVSSGLVSGIASGSTLIVYTLSNGCATSSFITVNTTPAAITGTTSVCLGLTTSLFDGTGGGAWSSSNTLNATVVPGSGVVTAVAASPAIISYVMPTGCFTTTTVTINTLPVAITGTLSVCEGATTTLSDPSGAGSWGSSNPSNASVAGSTGVVTGIAAGTTIITFTAPTSCITTSVLTVNPLPSPIGGVFDVCVGSTTSVNDADAGGTWSISPGFYATISGGGTISGIAAGNPTVSYTLPTGCVNTAMVNVNPLPAAITGAASVCAGATTNLSDASGGGTWASSDVSKATVIAGSGAVTGVAAGIPVITYQLPTGCFTTGNITVNASPASITGTLGACVGSTTTLSSSTLTGSWVSADPTVATIGATTGVVAGMTAGTTTITYSLPTGCNALKVATVYALPVAYTVTGGGGFCAGDTGVHVFLSGSLVGTSYQLFQGPTAVGSAQLGTTSAIDFGLLATAGTYTAIGTISSTGCSANMISSSTITINAAPPAITGPSNVCAGSAITLADAVTGGSWMSSDIAFATVGSASGNVSGVMGGTAMITYKLPTGCWATTTVAIDTLPAAISGTGHVCKGLTTTLTNAGGGTWISGSGTVASIGTSGVVTGLNAGTSMISYQLASGCMATLIATVNPLPTPIIGDANVCVNSTTYMSDASGGGTWASGSTGVASLLVTNGVFKGIAAGTTTITYTLPTGCITTTNLTVDPLPNAGTITGATTLCATKTITLSDPVSGGFWSSTGKSNVSLNGDVTGVIPGKDTIIYSVTNMCGVAYAKYPITITQCDFTAVPVITNNAAELKVFPNPNDGAFNVNLVSDVNEPLTIVISNMVGQTVKQFTTTTNNEFSVRMNVAAGVYMLSGYTAHGKYVAKVTVN